MTNDAAIEIDLSLVERLTPPLAERLSALRTQLGSGEVTLLAVSKGQPVEAIVAARRLGLDLFGENYAQELVAKVEALGGADAGNAPTWHFVGMLQRNKVRPLREIVDVWQSVDRLRVGAEIAKRAPGARVFAQANLSDDPGKAGCALPELAALIESLRELELDVQGVMGVGAAADDAATRTGFRQLRERADREGLSHCSMGMSGDMAIAIDEGSTMIRIGSALFGPRQG